jgi:hypothetical protein
MEMPRPSREQEDLSILVGDWLGQEQLHPSPFDPVGGPAVGRVYNWLALDGFAVIQDYEQERKGAVNFRGHGIFRWAAADKCYALCWFDSFGLPPATFRGALQHKVLTLTAPQPPGFARAVKRLCLTRSVPGMCECSQMQENRASNRTNPMIQCITESSIAALGDLQTARPIPFVE